MKSKIKDLPKSQKEITVEISVEEMEKYMSEALDRLSRGVKINGFRQGKAPKDIVRRQIGDFTIFEEASRIAIEDSYLKIVRDNKMEPLGQPRAEITKAALGNPLEYKIVVSVMPEVKLGDYKSVSGKMKVAKIKDEQVEEELKVLQKKRSNYITEDREARKGDRVEIDFEARIGGVKIEGGESRNHPLVIGSGKFVPGFEDELIGMRKGDVKEFDIIFPENYHKKELAGKNVSFKVEMKLVQRVDLPQLTDDFARSLGRFRNLKDLKKSIREGMEMEERDRAREEFRNKLMEQVSEKTVVEIPDVLIESELDNMISEFKSNIAQTGMEFKEYLRNVGTNVEKLREEWRSAAEKRVKTALIVREISIRENIKVTDEEVEKRVNDTLKLYPNEEEVRKSIDIERFKNYTAGMIMNEKVFEMLERIAESNAK